MAGGHGSPGPLTVESVPAGAGGGAPGEATLEHFVFHAPPRRQFLMPPLSTDLTERTRNQVRHYRSPVPASAAQHLLAKVGCID